MKRVSLLVLCSTVAVAQIEPRGLFDGAMQGSQEARMQGGSADAAAHREQAAKLLEQMPAGTPQWAGDVQNLAQSYQSSGWHARARAVVEAALERTNTLPDWHPTRMQLFRTLADYWEQDGNLLKALSYREQAAAAFEAKPPGAPAEGAVVGFIGNPLGLRASTYPYQQLADLYRQLGRSEAASQTLAKMRALMQKDLGPLAYSYEQEGDFNRALALYQKLAEEVAGKAGAQAWELINPLQSRASIYEREQDWADALVALQQAAARLDASGDPQARDQSSFTRLRVAGLLQRSGQTQAADQMYQALLSSVGNDPQGSQAAVAVQYANHLADTDRAAQGLQMLTDYQAAHADLQPQQQINILMSLSQIARKNGQNDLAEQYQREGQEERRALQPPPATGQIVTAKMQEAQRAANEGRLDEAMHLALGAIAAASGGSDGDQVSWQGPNLANQLAARGAAGKGEQIYRALLPLLETRAVDNLNPLIQARQQYIRFLMGQSDRWSDVSLAIDRFQDSVTAGLGADTDAAVQVQNFRIQIAQLKGNSEEATQKAEELLALEESLSGTTSARYKTALQTAAGAYQTSGKLDRALPLESQIVAIADLTLTVNDPQRAFLRMSAAIVFASARQFEEAERLAGESLTIASAAHALTEILRKQAEQIAQMKAAAARP
jgi:hypothetical protein